MVYIIRELKAGDIFAIDKLYDSLSERSKLFLHLSYLGFRSISLSWVQVHIALLLSSMKAIRKILKRLIPYVVFFTLVMTNEECKLIAFSFVKLKGRLEPNVWWGELVMCIRDGYQGMGLGSRLMLASKAFSRNEGIKGIFGSALKINVGTLHFDQKHGFKIIRVVRGGVCWHGRRYDNVEMWMDILPLKPRSSAQGLPRNG